MPDGGERKKNWEDTWAHSFEEGFYDNVDGAEEEKRALIIETDAQGRTKVVGEATGAEAERIIAEAQASGVEVRQNAAQLEQLLRQEQEGGEVVPPEIYDLMSTIIGFAEELGQEWASRGSDALPRAGRITEVEYSHEDIE